VPHPAATTFGACFLAEEVVAGIGFRQAQARFVSLLHGDWLAEVSQTAYGETVTGLLRVGPAGSVAAKLVRVSFLDPIYRDNSMSMGLRWEAAGATDSLFPVLSPAWVNVGSASSAGNSVPCPVVASQWTKR
jgi:hypothetical protein